jgi:hypothetical protein
VTVGSDQGTAAVWPECHAELARNLDEVRVTVITVGLDEIGEHHYVSGFSE